ncbi:MAG: hypothetical protein IT371_13975 [Deltaproteobacteria bacterium]|nr:hypothetical protein [Deltaproteobacteria bacterium]
MPWPLILDNLLAAALTLCGLAALLLVLHLGERAVGRQLARRLGWRAVLLTGWLGVPVHELGHLALARLFGHRILAWALFEPDPESGTLGYVRHAYSRRSLYQRLGSFFIAIAPLLSGGAALVALLVWMLPGPALADLYLRACRLGALDRLDALPGALHQLLAALGQAVWVDRTALLPLQLYLGVCVASHLAPSAADCRNGLPGLLLVLFGGALACALAGLAGHSTRASLALLPAVAALWLLVALFQLLYLGLVELLHGLGRRRGLTGSLRRGEK